MSGWNCAREMGESTEAIAANLCLVAFQSKEPRQALITKVGFLRTIMARFCGREAMEMNAARTTIMAMAMATKKIILPKAANTKSQRTRTRIIALPCI